MRTLLLLLAAVSNAFAYSSVNVTIENKNILTTDQTEFQTPSNMNRVTVRSLLTPYKSGVYEIGAYSFIDYSKELYVIDQNNTISSRADLRYTHAISDWKAVTSASFTKNGFDTNYSFVEFNENPLSLDYNYIVNVGVISFNDYSTLNSYYIFNRFYSEGDTIYSKSLYNTFDFTSGEIISKINIEADIVAKPIFNETRDKSDYYGATVSLQRVDNVVKNLDLKLSLQRDYGSNFYDDLLFTSNASYAKKLGKNRLKLSYHNDYSTTYRAVLRQSLDVELFSNRLNSDLNLYGYSALIRVIDKYENISILSRLKIKYYLIASLYTAPEAFLYINRVSKSVTNRDGFEFGYSVVQGLDIYVKPQFEIYKMNSMDFTHKAWYVQSGIDYSF